MTHHHIKRGRSLHQKAFLHPPNCFICKITLRGFRFGTILTKETFGFLGFITKQQLLGQPWRSVNQHHHLGASQYLAKKQPASVTASQGTPRISGCELASQHRRSPLAAAREAHGGSSRRFLKSLQRRHRQISALILPYWHYWETRRAWKIQGFNLHDGEELKILVTKSNCRKQQFWKNYWLLLRRSLSEHLK